MRTYELRDESRGRSPRQAAAVARLGTSRDANRPGRTTNRTGRAANHSNRVANRPGQAAADASVAPRGHGRGRRAARWAVDRAASVWAGSAGCRPAGSAADCVARRVSRRAARCSGEEARLHRLWRRVARASEEPTAGWTFVETLIVIAIILVLTSTVGFMAFRYLGNARVAATRSQIETLSLALNAYMLDNDRYPTEGQGLEALWEKPVLEPVPPSWNGPYLTKELPKDPWGIGYLYRVPGPNGLPFAIMSLGADALEGGEGNDADISSWES